MPRPKKPDRLLKKTVAVPASTRAAMEAAGPDVVRSMLAQLPKPSFTEELLHALEVGEKWTAEDLAPAIGATVHQVRGAMSILGRDNRVVVSKEDGKTYYERQF